MLEQGQKPDMMVEMVVPLEEIEARLGLRGRDQDEPEVVEERYNAYEATKGEIMAYLAGNGVKVVSVDGVGTMDEVYVRTVNAIREA